MARSNLATWLARIVVAATFLLVPASSAGAVTTLSEAGQHAQNLDVAEDSTGAAHVVWQRHDGTNMRVQYVRIDASGTPGPVLDLSEAGQDADHPQIAVDAADVAHVVWRRRDGTAFIERVQYVRIGASGTPGLVQTISGTDYPPSTGSVRVAADATGAAHVLWVQSDGSEARATYVRISAAGTPGSMQTLSAPGRSVTNMNIAGDSTGAAHVVWRRDATSSSLVQYVRVSPVGVPDAIQTLSEAGRYADVPHVAVEASSDAAHVVWFANDGTFDRIQHVRITAAGVLGATTTLSPTGGHANEPRVAVDATGAAHVVWERGDGLHDRAQYVRVGASGSVGDVLTLSEAGQRAERPRVAVDSAGAAHVAWARFDGTNDRAQYTRIGASGAAAPVTTLSEAGQTANSVRVAVDPMGTAHAVWARLDGTTLRAQYEPLRSQVNAAPGSLAFGDLGMSDGASAAQPVTVSNAASAPIAGFVRSVTVTGSGAAAFSVSANACTGDVAPGASCSISVVFDPATAGAHTAQLVLSVSGSSAPATIALSGTGTAPPVVTPPPTVTPGVTCPAGTSASVTCVAITATMRSRYGCAPGSEKGVMMTGTGRAERFVGTGRGDIIVAGGGVDTISSGVGNDSVWADAGNDTVRAGSGDDCIHGGVGNDAISGGIGNDIAHGDAGRDTLKGESGNDTLRGNADPDSIFGGLGNDRLYGGRGPDTRLDGGPGRNQVYPDR